MIRYTATANGQRLRQVILAIDAGGPPGSLEIMDASQNVLAVCALSSPCATRMGGTITFEPIAAGQVILAGTAALARVRASNGTIVVLGLTVTATGGGGDIELASTALTTSMGVRVTSLSLLEPEAVVSTVADIRLQVSVSDEMVNEGESAYWSVMLSGHKLQDGDVVSYVLTPTGGQAEDFPTNFDTTMAAIAAQYDTNFPGWGSYAPATNTVTVTHLAPNPIVIQRTFVEDGLTEGDETFRLTASNLSHGVIQTAYADIYVVDTSKAADTTPIPFTFTDVTGAAASTTYTSNSITVLDINEPAPISITSTNATGQYEKNGSGVWTNSNGTVVANDTVRVRVTSGGGSNTAHSTTLTIGGIADTFEVMTADTIAPVLSSATWTGSTVSLTYDEALDAASVPAAGAFTVLDDGAGVAVSSVSIAGATVTLALSAAPAVGSTVTVSYTAGAAPLQDAAGNDAANLSNQAVTGASSATVTNAAELSAALSAASAGDVIVLANGNYGPLATSKKAVGDYIIIRAQNKWGAYFTSSGGDAINLNDVSYLHFDKVEVRGNTYMINSDHVKFTEMNCTSGFNLRESSYIVCNDNVIHYVPSHAINTVRITNFEFRRNHITDTFADCFRFAGDCRHGVIENNVSLNLRPIRYPDGSYVHADHLQGFSSNGITPSNLLIRGNHFWDDPTDQEAANFAQGIFLSDPSSSDGYRNVTVEENLLHGSTNTLVLVEGTVNCFIRRNTVMNGRIALTGNMSGTHVENNITPALLHSVSTKFPNHQPATYGSNLIISTSDTSSPNYILNVLQGTNGGAWQSYLPVPGGPADFTTTNYGAQTRLAELQAGS